MATIKLGTLVIRTLAKPISALVKKQVMQHERFRHFCVSLAQNMYRTEVRLRTNILGEPAKHIRPLSEAKAIENGANFMAEAFLFSVAAALIIGETWRSSRVQSKRRYNVDEQLDALTTSLQELTTRVDDFASQWEQRLHEEKQKNDELARILERIVEIGLRGGWAEFETTPLQIPRISLVPSTRSSGPESSLPPPDPPLPTNPPKDASSQSDSNPTPRHIV